MGSTGPHNLCSPGVRGSEQTFNLETRPLNPTRSETALCKKWAVPQKLRLYLKFCTSCLLVVGPHICVASERIDAEDWYSRP